LFWINIKYLHFLVLLKSIDGKRRLLGN